MVTACCRFLCYFCRTSRANQKAMFEHLGYLLDNSAMLLSQPSLRGSGRRRDVWVRASACVFSLVLAHCACLLAYRGPCMIFFLFFPTRSAPLDVAYSSLMDNNMLALALRESHLEKVTIYLSKCDLNSNQVKHSRLPIVIELSKSNLQ